MPWTVELRTDCGVAEAIYRRRILPAAILPLLVVFISLGQRRRELKWSGSSIPRENKPFYFSNSPLMGAMARAERTRGLKCSGRSMPQENKPFYFSISRLMGAMSRVERTRGLKCSVSSKPREKNKPFYFSISPLTGRHGSGWEDKRTEV